MKKIQPACSTFKDTLVRAYGHTECYPRCLLSIIADYYHFASSESERFAELRLFKNGLVSPFFPKLFLSGILLTDLRADKETHIFIV